MRRSLFTLAVALLFAVPVWAADCDNPIRSISAPDGQTGAPLRLQWSLGGMIPQSQTLSGHDFDAPVVVNPGLTSFVYVPEQPGQKHATLSVVTDCGTFTRDFKYHVQQCNVAAPILTLDQQAVAAGGTVTASVDLPPGHTARWVVRNGTPSATEGSSIQITAGTTGLLRVDVFVKRGDQNSNSCEVRAARSIPIQAACTILDPQIYYSTQSPTPDSVFFLFVNLGPGEAATFNVTNATVTYSDAQFVEVMTPTSGSFSIDITVSKPGCSKTYPHTWEVTPCEPTATVSVVPGNSCGASTIAVDFTGTAPFQGYWSDGRFFFTRNNRLERTVTTGGTYTVAWFADARCVGTVSGSAEVTGALPQPLFGIEEMVNGWWYGWSTCPGMIRTASLQVPAPAGAEVVWSIENGTILSGQGTGTIQWSGTNPGPSPLTAMFRTADGCTSQPYSIPHIVTQGVPSMSVTVEPSTIDLGQTAIVKVTRNNDYVNGWNVYSSLGDVINPIGPIDERTYQYEYRSTQGAGVATITVDAMNMCGLSSTAQTTLTINQGAPVQATATIRQYGTTCADYIAVAELTGVAPFSGTWSNGLTFTSDYPYAYLYPTEGGTYTLVQFSDADGAGTVTGSATFDYVQIPAPAITFSTANACPNSTVTAAITSPIPDGANVEWWVSGGTIVSGQGTGAIEILTGEYGINVNVKITSPSACSPWSNAYLPVASSYVMQPAIDAYGVETGGTTNVWITLDPNTATWGFENSMGDAMAIVDNPYPNFYMLSYTSSHGPGESAIRVYGTTTCGVAFESTRVMTVRPPAPTATLTSAPSGTCHATITATLTGAAPYTIRWNDGETLTTSDTTVTRVVQGSQYVSLTVTDANGQIGFGDVWAQATVPYPDGINVATQVCVNGTVTATAGGIPEGATPFWYILEPNARIISGQGTNEVVVEGLEPGWFGLSVRYTTAEGCTSGGTGAMIEVTAPAANPVITLPVTSIAAGATMDFTVAFDGFQYHSLSWESSNGDPIYSVGQVGMTFTLRYVSVNGPGPVTIRAYGTPYCGGPVEATATLTIDP